VNVGTGRAGVGLERRVGHRLEVKKLSGFRGGKSSACLLEKRGPTTRKLGAQIERAKAVKALKD